MKQRFASVGGIVLGVALLTTVALAIIAFQNTPESAGQIRRLLIAVCAFLFAVLAFGAFTSLQQEGRQRSTEQNLQDSESRAGVVLETAVDAIISIDERGTIEAFNQAAERMLGYPRNEVIGKNVSLLM